MPIVETTIKVSIPEGGVSMGDLERCVGRAGEEAGRELLGKVCQMLEEEGLAALRRRRQAQQVKIRPLDVLTRFGWLRLERRQVCRSGDGALLLSAGRSVGPKGEASLLALGTGASCSAGDADPLPSSGKAAGRLAGGRAGPSHGPRLGAAGRAGCGGRRGR